MHKVFPWIAIVDDDEPVRRALSRLLRSARLNCRAFASGEEFLDSLGASHHPQCVVLDLHMPGMTGKEVHAQLSRQAPDIAVIIVTGQYSDELETQSLRNGALVFLHKPMNDESLLDAIAIASNKTAIESEQC